MVYSMVYGYIDMNGTQVIGPPLRRAESFRDGVAAVENDDGKWIIDTFGQILGPYTPASIALQRGAATR